MWRFLKRGYCFSSDQVVATEEPMTGRCLLELDPISVAGRLNMQALFQSLFILRFTALTAIIGSIIDSQMHPITIKVTPGDQARWPHVHDDYLPHLNALELADILTKDHGEVRFFNGYFAVPKQDKARAIFNGKRLSTRCDPPPPVNLPMITEVLRRLCSIAQRRRKLYCVALDMRHWFHQISVCPEINRYFGLRAGDKTWRWRTLPMGWSHSPAVAQACCLALLINREVHEEPFFDESAVHGTQLPTFIPLISGCGFGTAYYDNIIIASDNENDIKQAEARIQRTCELFGAVIKENSWRRFVTRPLAPDEQPFDFLGVEITGSFEQRRGRHYLTELRWESIRKTQWTESASQAGGSLQDMATVFGRLLNLELLSCLPLCATGDGRGVARLARALGKEAYSASWSGACSPALRRGIMDAWNTRCAQPGYSLDCTKDAPEPATYSHIVCSDASDKKWGYTWEAIGGDEGNQITIGEFWKETWRDRHIFLKEMRAARIATEAFCECNPAVTHAYLLVDNSAVCWALRAGVTNSIQGSEDLERIVSQRIRWEVILLISEDNPADVPTRPEKSSEELRLRWTHARKAVESHLKGWRWASKPHRSWLKDNDASSCVRHAAPDDMFASL